MQTMNNFHLLDKGAAKKCGVNGALIMWHFRFWIDKNRANERNFHDGRYWTYNSMDALCKTFDYLTSNQIRTALDKLVKDGYLLKGNYNKSSYDRTTWYAITDAGYAIFSDYSSANAVAEITKSICDKTQMEQGNNANGFGNFPNSIRGTDTIPDTDLSGNNQINTPPVSPRRGACESVPVSDSEKPKKPSKPKKPKEPKVSYAEFVTMTETEHQKLIDQYGEAKTARMIEILNNYKGSSGKKYASDYMTCLNWVAKRADEDMQRNAYQNNAYQGGGYGQGNGYGQGGGYNASDNYGAYSNNVPGAYNGGNAGSPQTPPSGKYAHIDFSNW